MKFCCRARLTSEMKRTIAVLLLGLLIGSSSGQGMFGRDWMKDLLESINQLNTNIQGNVQRINQQIQESVQGHLARIDRLNSDMAQKIGKTGQQTLMLGNTGSTILINGAGGTSRTVFSGHGPNGEPYFRDSEDRVVGDILHHTERVYNPVTGSMDEYRYTLDLKDPKAKPVPA